MFLVVVMLLIGTSLAACNRSDSNGDDVLIGNDPFAETSARPEDRFGKGFGKAFRADPMSEPAKVTQGDVTPVSLTAEPLPTH